MELVEVADTGVCKLLVGSRPPFGYPVRSIEDMSVMRHNSDSRGVELIRGPDLA